MKGINRKFPRGFLLIEVMMALAIMAVGAVAAYTAFSLVKASATMMTQEEIAWHLAQQKMEETLNDPAILDMADNGSFEPDEPAYQWVRSAREMSPAEMGMDPKAAAATGCRLIEVMIEVTRSGWESHPPCRLATRVARVVNP